MPAHSLLETKSRNSNQIMYDMQYMYDMPSPTPKNPTLVAKI